MRLTKSWAVTLLFAVLAAGLPVFDQPLQDRFGIVITDKDLTHLMTMFGISGGLGVGNAVRKNVAAKKAAPVRVTSHPHGESVEDLINDMPESVPPPRGGATNG